MKSIEERLAEIERRLDALDGGTKQEVFKLMPTADELPSWPWFDSFWAAYPAKGRERAKSRETVKREWRKLKPGERPDRETMLSALDAWKASESWQGGYVVGAQRFVKERMWQDPPEVRREKVGIGFAKSTPKPPAPPRETVSRDEALRILNG